MRAHGDLMPALDATSLLADAHPGATASPVCGATHGCNKGFGRHETHYRACPCGWVENDAEALVSAAYHVRPYPSSADAGIGGALAVESHDRTMVHAGTARISSVYGFEEALGGWIHGSPRRNPCSAPLIGRSSLALTGRCSRYSYAAP